MGLGVLILGTSGATPPPDYLVATPDKVTHTTAPVVTTTTPTGQPSAAPPTPDPMVFIGDSVANTLAPALAAEAGRHGVSLTAAVRPGCGVLTGYPVANGVRVPWGIGCSDNAPGYQNQVIADFGPQAVVMLSSWESGDREINGAVVPLDSPQAEQVWRGLLDEARARLTAGGARLVLTLLPPPADFSDAGPANQENVHRIQRLNGFYRRYAKIHPDSVSLVDLAKIVCPGGPPCPETIDAVALRPRDGGHFSEDGALWVAPRFYDAIVQALIPPPAA